MRIIYYFAMSADSSNSPKHASEATMAIHYIWLAYSYCFTHLPDNLYHSYRIKGVICKSPWIKVDMVALFLLQDVAQL